ncbi:MAG: hypothetical protein M3T55_06895 [Pseudomonadota bacterium]|nr:hypothetical protein [Pseudomonadota bacterium]
MTDDKPDAFPQLAARAVASDRKAVAVNHEVDDLGVRAAADRRADYIRLVLAVAVMFVYLGSVAAALYWFGSRIPAAPTDGKTLDAYSSAVLDILKVLVLPIVTLMLGFYFGTGASNKTSTAK